MPLWTHTSFALWLSLTFFFRLLVAADCVAAMAVDVFSVPVFLVVFRETLETVIIVSVLLAFLKQTLTGPESDLKTYKTLRRQVCLSPERQICLCLCD